jgi:hypothetical protein
MKEPVSVAGADVGAWGGAARSSVGLHPFWGSFGLESKAVLVGQPIRAVYEAAVLALAGPATGRCC